MLLQDVSYLLSIADVLCMMFLSVIYGGQIRSFMTDSDDPPFSKYIFGFYSQIKGQIKPKAVWTRRRFSQKMNEQIRFVCREKQKSKQNKFVLLFFWENLRRANLLPVLADLYKVTFT